MTFTVKWKYGKNPARQEAIWFYGDNYIGEASLVKNGETYTLDIYCDGETRFEVPYRNEDGTLDLDSDTQVIRYANEWEAIGVHTDEELRTLVGSLWDKHGYEAHRYNSWFDLYVEIGGVSQHIDAVTHTQDDAEAQAEAILLEVAEIGGWEKWFDK